MYMFGVRRPLRILGQEKRKTFAFEFVLVSVYFVHVRVRGGFLDLNLRVIVLCFRWRDGIAKPGQLILPKSAPQLLSEIKREVKVVA